MKRGLVRVKFSKEGAPITNLKKRRGRKPKQVSLQEPWVTLHAGSLEEAMFNIKKEPTIKEEADDKPQEEERELYLQESDHEIFEIILERVEKVGRYAKDES